MIALFLLNSAIVALVVIVHYEFLFQLSSLLPKLKLRHRFRIVLAVFGAMVAHAVEIWLFAFCYYFMHHAKGWGHLEGNVSGELLDFSYFSFTTYTTLGLGDIAPIGDIRHLTGIESLTGLVLITWTASFLFYEMQRNWGES